MDSIRHINPSNLNDVVSLQKAVEQLINVVEELARENEQLKERNGQLKDENAVLKGGNARPVLKGRKQKNRDISSGGKEKGTRKISPVKGSKRRVVNIDREIKAEMDEQAFLPPDAVFKGYVPYIQQDLRIARDNKRFLLATYYSASENKTYKAAFPEGEIAGHFGAGVRSLLNILHHYGNVTTSSLGGLMKGLGIQISTGSISNLLKAEHGWVVAEQTEILQAGLSPQRPVQMDCTGNRQRGENKVTHIITAPLFSTFYTLNSKSRLSCLKALQGNPPDGLKLMWDKDMEGTFREAKVSKVDSKHVMQLLRKQDTTQMNISAFDLLLQKYAPAVYARQRIVSVLREVMALHYYNNQDKFKRLKLLMSDDAPEYNKIAEHHGLCWIHDARYYNKLSPRFDANSQKLNSFMAQYWTFYQSLLDYKTFSEKKQIRQRPKIIKTFDRLFQPTTKYGHLDLCIKRTAANKDQLLLTLDFPALPLHNNAAELGARKVVRKRDISLHTWTDWGTQLRDAFLSIVETARKLNIPIYDYINDRITGKYMLPSLAEVIISKTR